MENKITYILTKIT